MLYLFDEPYYCAVNRRSAQGWIVAVEKDECCKELSFLKAISKNHASTGTMTSPAKSTVSSKQLPVFLAAASAMSKSKSRLCSPLVVRETGRAPLAEFEEPVRLSPPRPALGIHSAAPQQPSKLRGKKQQNAA